MTTTPGLVAGCGNAVYTWTPSVAGRASEALRLSSRVLSVQIAPTNQAYVIGSEDGTASAFTTSDSARVLDLPQQDEAEAFATAGAASVVRLTSDSSRLAVGYGSGVIRLWDCKAVKLVHIIPDHPDSVLSLAISQDDRVLASSSTTGTVSLHKMRDGLKFTDLVLGSAAIAAHTGLAFSPATTSAAAAVLAGASSDGNVCTWTLGGSSPSQRTVMHRHTGRATGTTFYQPMPAVLLSCGFDKQLAVIDTRSRKVTQSRLLDFPTCIASYDGGNYVGVGSEGGVLYVFDPRRMDTPLDTSTLTSGMPVCELSWKLSAPKKKGSSNSSGASSNGPGSSSSRQAEAAGRSVSTAGASAATAAGAIAPGRPGMQDAGHAPATAGRETATGGRGGDSVTVPASLRAAGGQGPHASSVTAVDKHDMSASIAGRQVAASTAQPLLNGGGADLHPGSLGRLAAAPMTMDAPQAALETSPNESPTCGDPNGRISTSGAGPGPRSGSRAPLGHQGQRLAPSEAGLKALLDDHLAAVHDALRENQLVMLRSFHLQEAQLAQATQALMTQLVQLTDRVNALEQQQHRTLKKSEALWF